MKNEGRGQFWFWSLAARLVLCMRQATVTGPTPPGTGVTRLATVLTLG